MGRRTSPSSSISSSLLARGCESDDRTNAMDDRLRKWQPTQAEVDEIVRSLRPLIRELARRDQEKIATEIIRRRRRIAHRAIA